MKETKKRNGFLADATSRSLFEWMHLALKRERSWFIEDITIRAIDFKHWVSREDYYYVEAVELRLSTIGSDIKQALAKLREVAYVALTCIVMRTEESSEKAFVERRGEPDRVLEDLLRVEGEISSGATPIECCLQVPDITEQTKSMHLMDLGGRESLSIGFDNAQGTVLLNVDGPYKPLSLKLVVSGKHLIASEPDDAWTINLPVGIDTTDLISGYLIVELQARPSGMAEYERLWPAVKGVKLLEALKQVETLPVSKRSFHETILSRLFSTWEPRKWLGAEPVGQSYWGPGASKVKSDEAVGLIVYGYEKEHHVALSREGDNEALLVITLDAEDPSSAKEIEVKIVVQDKDIELGKCKIGARGFAEIPLDLKEISDNWDCLTILWFGPES